MLAISSTTATIRTTRWRSLPRRQGGRPQIAVHHQQQWAIDRRRLGCLEPDATPRATAHIPEQIAMVRTLEAKGHTYLIDDGVYFDTATFPRYAEFAGLDLNELVTSGRVEHVEAKRHPADFALWKRTPPGSRRQQNWEKSKGHLLVVDSLLERGLDPLSFRYFFLQAHYRQQQSFTWEAMEASATAHRRLLRHAIAARDAGGSPDVVRVDAHLQRFWSVADELNTSCGATGSTAAAASRRSCRPGAP